MKNSRHKRYSWAAMMALLPLIAGVNLAQAAEGDGPVIELPPSDESASQAPAAQKQSKTHLGGYAEMHYNLAIPDEGDSQGTLDFHRLVLFVSHQFSDRVSFHSEIEIEHALVSKSDPGEVGIEQAAVDLLVADSSSPVGELGLRAGIVLVPMGLINQNHEPPIFHGVERPNVDKLIIPSTWREGGIGIFGRPNSMFSYELYLLSAFNADGFSAKNGVRSGRQAIAQARADSWAVAGRVDFQPLSSLKLGLSGYWGRAGPNMDEAYLPSGAPADLDVPVTGLSADLLAKWKGLEARLVFATFYIGDTDRLRTLMDAEGESLGFDVGAQTLGFYGELAYDLLRLADSSHQLLPFVRVERYNTLEDIKGRLRTEADRALGVTDIVAGLSYRPVPGVVFKGDVIFRSPDGQAKSMQVVNFGVGLMF